MCLNCIMQIYFISPLFPNSTASSLILTTASTGTVFYNQNIIVAQDVLSTTITANSGATNGTIQIPSLTANANNLVGQVLNFTNSNSANLVVVGPRSLPG